MMPTSVLVFLVGVLAFMADAAGPGAAAEVQAPTESQQEAKTLLLGMANYLARSEAFSVSLQAGYDVVQADGRKIEFLEARNILVARPDRMRIDERGGAGSGSALLFDGKMMTVWDSANGVFAQVGQPGSLDDAIVYFVRDLGMRLPLAPLLITTLADELQRRVVAVDYVELTEALGEPAHHVEGRTASVQFQAWIADGEQPLPLRIVLTYEEPGQPQYWAQFSDWNVRPRIRKGAFAFDPPDGARQILFQSQVSPLNPAAPAGGVAEPEEAQ